MPRVLLISFTYPPGFGSGGIRISKFAKFLPEFGWDPVVLTVDPRHYPFRGGFESLLGTERRVTTGFFDPLGLFRSLYPMENAPTPGGSPASPRPAKKRLPPAVRSVAKYFWDMIYFPDPQIGWYPYAVTAGRRILRREKFDAIFSSSPPHTDHLIGARLAAAFRVPWVAEYRDPWTDQHTYRKPWPMSALERRLERRTLAGASAVITISPTMAKILSGKLKRPVYVIENGFDPDDLPSPDPQAAADVPFTLVHAGTLYRGQRDPGLFFDGLKILKEMMDLTPARFQAQFVGVLSEMALDLAARRDVSELVTAQPRVPYADALRLQSRASALLLLGLNDPMGGGVLTGKMFEYFGLRRPILGVGAPDADLEEILRRTRTGKFVSTPEAVAETLSDWIRSHERSGTVPYDPDDRETVQYTRIKAAEKLATILKGATSKKF